MKKFIAAILATLILTAGFTSCGRMTEPDTTTETPASTTDAPTQLPYSNATELIEIIFEKYNASQQSDDTKLFVGGGNVNNFDTCKPDGPAAFVPVENEDYDQNLGYPAADADKISSAASMFNMMNSNIFNCYTVEFKEGTDVDTMIGKLKNNILDRQWICGSPEKLVIAKAPGNCIIVVWGAVESGGLVDPVVKSVTGSVKGAEVVVEERIAR